MFKILDVGIRKSLKWLIELDELPCKGNKSLSDKVNEFLRDRPEQDGDDFRKDLEYLNRNNFIEYCQDDCFDILELNSKGRDYFDFEKEDMDMEKPQQISTTYNIQGVSQSIIGSQQNATVNVQCNSIEDLERLISEKGQDDKAELFALANEIKGILESIQQNTELPQKKGLFGRLSDHASKHGWFYGAAMNLVGTLFMQMYFK